MCVCVCVCVCVYVYIISNGFLSLNACILPVCAHISYAGVHMYGVCVCLCVCVCMCVCVCVS
jgi:hypothetical protein